MESQDWHDAFAALAWQVDLGADEAILDAPINRFELPQEAPKPAKPQAAPKAAPMSAAAKPAEFDAVGEARQAAQSAPDLAALRAAMEAYPHCDLKAGARQLVFSDGVPGSRVMIIGEAPGRDEDREGRPFVGRAGQLLDRMLTAIGHARTDNIYITNVIPWRPPQNRDPSPAEIAMMVPFLERHVALAAPKLLVVMGNTSAQAVLGKRGITRLRGTWDTAFGLPVLPMLHPVYLLRQPNAKRETWADLLDLQARLREGS